MSLEVKSDRCTYVWHRAQEFFPWKGTADRLQQLTLGMLKKKDDAKAPPKLRASAAQVRNLVPLGRELAEELLDTAVPLEEAALFGTRHLWDCYEALSSSTPEWQERLSRSSRLFASLFVALDNLTGGDIWRVKPKLHCLLHLCSDGGKPSMNWTYRDGDFGGSCSHWARRRGGLHRPGAASKNLLSRFAMVNPVPVIR